MMKILLIFSVLFAVMSCKELGDAIYEPPVIESFELIYDEPVLPLDTVTAFVSASNPEKGELSYSWEVSLMVLWSIVFPVTLMPCCPARLLS